MAPGPWYEVVPVSIETQRPVQKKAPGSSDPTITLIVFVCAILIGSSSGILIADREDLLGQKVRAAAQSVGRLTSLPSKSDPGAGKSGSRAPETAKESKPAARPSNKALQSEASPLGDIHYSEQPDSASVDVEMESAVLVRTEKVHSPERIYFDLRDSRQQEGPMDNLRTKRAVPTNGTLVARVRVSEWESGGVRLVLDLERPCDYTYELSPGPSSRLLVKLQARTPGDISSK
jgi:hypothetical protein